MELSVKARKFFVHSDFTTYTEPQLVYWYNGIEGRAPVTPSGNAIDIPIPSSPHEILRPSEPSAWAKQAIAESAREDLTWDRCSLSGLKITNGWFIDECRQNYNYAAIVDEIARTYLRGRPLHLAGVMFDPLEDEIVLYPNKSLGATSSGPVVFEPKMASFPRYNNLVVTERPGLSRSIGPWKTPLTALCANGGRANESFGDNEELILSETPVFRNRRFLDLDFSGTHWRDPPAVFQNCHFVRCKWTETGCWCGVRFVSCRFTRCVTYKGVTVPRFTRCISDEDGELEWQETPQCSWKLSIDPLSNHCPTSNCGTVSGSVADAINSLFRDN